MFKVDFNGLRRKPHYDELVDYIQNGNDKISYPNRAATFAFKTNQFQQFLNQSISELQDQEMRLSQEKVKMETLRQAGSLRQPRASGPHPYYVDTPGSSFRLVTPPSSRPVDSGGDTPQPYDLLMRDDDIYGRC
jgi:hypothetical protein